MEFDKESAFDKLCQWKDKKDKEELAAAGLFDIKEDKNSAEGIEFYNSFYSQNGPLVYNAILEQGGYRLHVDEIEKITKLRNKTMLSIISLLVNDKYLICKITKYGNCDYVPNSSTFTKEYNDKNGNRFTIKETNEEALWNCELMNDNNIYVKQGNEWVEKYEPRIISMENGIVSRAYSLKIITQRQKRKLIV